MELEQDFDHFPKYHMKILLGDFNAKVGWKNIFKRTIGNESLHQDSNDNGVRIVNFGTSNNLVLKSMMFLHWNIYKYTWTYPDGKTYNQIDHILLDRRWHSSILDVWSFREADCDTDHYLVVAEVREWLEVKAHCHGDSLRTASASGKWSWPVATAALSTYSLTRIAPPRVDDVATVLSCYRSHDLWAGM